METTERVQREINSLQYKLDGLTISKDEAAAALEHHLSQLERLGATLEDDICAILRKLIEQADIRKEIEKQAEHLRECKRNRVGLY